MIKIKEFTKKINELGFKVKIDDEDVKIIANPSCYGLIAVVSNRFEKVIDVNLFGYHNLDEDTKSKVFDLVTELAGTPIKDRKDEDKYFLRHNYLYRDKPSENYLNYYSDLDEYDLDDSLEMPGVQTKFTLKEIQDMSVKLKSNLSDFERSKVK